MMLWPMRNGVENDYLLKPNGNGQQGGLKDKIYPWGNMSVEEGIPRCNYWLGIFPVKMRKKMVYWCRTSYAV